MSLTTPPENPSALTERLRNAFAVTPSLIADIIRDACRRFPSEGRSVKSARMEQPIGIGAWTDAALGFVELELPQWRIRRLAYDDGEWYCALSRQRELPDWLDDSIEGRHADLALAILCAFVEVQSLNADTPSTTVPRAPQSATALGCS